MTTHSASDQGKSPASPTFTVRHHGYTSQVITTNDSLSAGRELVALGFTCDRQTYGPDDSITASYFHHKVNTHWTAEIVIEAEVTR